MVAAYVNVALCQQQHFCSNIQKISSVFLTNADEHNIDTILLSLCFSCTKYLIGLDHIFADFYSDGV